MAQCTKFSVFMAVQLSHLYLGVQGRLPGGGDVGPDLKG